MFAPGDLVQFARALEPVSGIGGTIVPTDTATVTHVLCGGFLRVETDYFPPWIVPASACELVSFAPDVPLRLTLLGRAALGQETPAAAS